MSADQDFAQTKQLSGRSYHTDYSIPAADLPLISTEASTAQQHTRFRPREQPANHSVFTSLLFDRAQIYRDRSTALSPYLTNPTGGNKSRSIVSADVAPRQRLRNRHSPVGACEGEQQGKQEPRPRGLLEVSTYSNDTDSPASRSKTRMRPLKRTRTMSKRDVKPNKANKRTSTSTDKFSVSKSRKTKTYREEGSVTKEVSNLSDSRKSLGSTNIEPIELSDDEERGNVRPLDTSWASIKTGSSESDTKLLQSKIDDIVLEHAQELQQLRQKLQTEKAEAKKMRQALEARIQDENSELEVLKHLHKRVDAEHERAKEEHAQTLESLMKDVQAKAMEAEGSMERIASLEKDKVRLEKEIETIRARTSTISSSRHNLPLPTDEERRVDNIGKTYIKVKRRLDKLHSVAMNLSLCTRSMDLSSFGDFGRYVRQLQDALDNDSHEGQTDCSLKCTGLSDR